VVLAVLAIPQASQAYSTSPDFRAQDYATGFRSLACCDWGPIGLAFDQSDNLYVANSADGHIYRFAPGGGAASDATRLTGTPLPGGLGGLAVAPDGRVYLARENAGDVVEIDPATGAIRRTVAAVHCATGLAADPVSGDLFVSQNQCGTTVWRISAFARGPGTALPYVQGLSGVDGMSFGNDGTLYAEANGQVVRIGGTSSPAPGAVTPITRVPNADGVAAGVAPPGGGPSLLVVNRTDGFVTRADLTTTPIAQTNIFSGGSRGDFAAVDSHGCLFITQTDRVVRISPAHRSCELSPSTSGSPGAPGVTLDVVEPRSAAGLSVPRASCARIPRLVVRVRQRGRVRLRSAALYIGSRRVKVVRGRAVTAPIVLRGLPPRAFTLKIVAYTTRGRRLITRRRLSGCRAPVKRVTGRKKAPRRKTGARR
jgi:hypothetical protein